MNGIPALTTAVHDVEGRVVPGRTVVFVNEASPPGRLDKDLEATTLGTYARHSLARNETYSWGTQEVLDGSAAGSAATHSNGVELICKVNCLFHFYLEHQRIVLSGVFDGRFRNQGLVIAEQAQALFEQWQTATSKNEN